MNFLGLSGLEAVQPHEQLLPGEEIGLGCIPGVERGSRLNGSEMIGHSNPSSVVKCMQRTRSQRLCHD
jgi:hypothetical protein